MPVNGEPVLRWSAPIGTSAKFAIPGVGAGRLYVGTRDGHVLAFGSPVTPVLSGPATAFPTTTVGERPERDRDAHRDRTADVIEPRLELLPVRARHAFDRAARDTHDGTDARSPDHVHARRRPARSARR